jgi:hypothetical protein
VRQGFGGQAGIGPFDKPLDTLGALSLSKRLRASDPGSSMSTTLLSCYTDVGVADLSIFILP